MTVEKCVIPNAAKRNEESVVPRDSSSFVVGMTQWSTLSLAGKNTSAFCPFAKTNTPDFV